MAIPPIRKTAEMRSFFFLLSLTYNNMSATILPPKENKIEQHNFKQYREAQDWLRSNRFKFKGYVDDERKEFFVERWEKDGLVALTMDITPFWNKLPLEILDKPYQIDIATF